MTANEADGTVFDEAVIEAVAESSGIDASELAALVYRHQTTVASLPGIENLVYEWRKHFEDPLVDRTEAAYYLAVPASVWDEFADHLDAREAAVDALVDVHRRTLVDQTQVTRDPPGDTTYVVLDRRVSDE